MRRIDGGFRSQEEAAKLAATNYPKWRALLLAVDFKGATVATHH